jgi:Tol biopolymer transport system component
VLAEGQWFEPQAWSADGRELLVRVERVDQLVDIGIVDVVAATYRRLRAFSRPFPGDTVRWSRDAAFIAYDVVPAIGEGQRDIHVMSARNGADVSVIAGPSSDSLVGWSADGRHLLFQSDRGHRVGLWAMPMSGGSVAGNAFLVREDFDAEPHAVTSRGDLFYERAVGASGGPLTQALMTATVDPANGTLVARPWFATRDRGGIDVFPRWSADGRQFLHVTWRRTGMSLSIHSLPLQQTREMPLGLAYIWTLDWSRDARWLALHATDLAGRNGIFLLDASTGRLELITPEHHDSVLFRTPQFTPDGRSVTYFASEMSAPDVKHVSYVRWDVATRSTQVIEREAAGLGPARAAMGRSPDGRYRLSILNLRRPPAVLFSYDTVTRRETELFRSTQANAFNPEDGMQWMPDGRAILVNVRGSRPNEFELWWIPVDGRQPKRVDIGIDNLVNSAIAVHPDGRQVAFLAGDPIPSFASSPRREFRLLRLAAPDTTKHDIP